MIRGGQQLGAVGIGSGGSYADYSFDSTGLSNDSRLPPYLQSLTPAQLQSALDGGNSVTSDLRSLLIDEQTGTGAGYLPSGISSAAADAGIPSWLLWAGVGLAAVVVVRGLTR